MRYLVTMTGRANIWQIVSAISIQAFFIPSIPFESSFICFVALTIEFAISTSRFVISFSFRFPQSPHKHFESIPRERLKG